MLFNPFEANEDEYYSQNTIDKEVLNISNWLKANKLSLNVKNKLIIWSSPERDILILILLYR